MVDPELLTLERVDMDEVLSHLSGRDSVMGDLIGRIGKVSLTAGGDYFESLVRAIVYQQLAGKAADSIYRKLLDELGGAVSATAMARMTGERFRASGISRQKAGYLTDLTEKVQAGELELEGIEKLTDSEIISILCVVKGIGKWTAQMFLIFTLGRMDVLPLNDLGFRNSLKKHYGIKANPSDSRIERIARKWAPYRTIGVWMLWEAENIRLPASGGNSP